MRRLVPPTIALLALAGCAPAVTVSGPGPSPAPGQAIRYAPRQHPDQLRAARLISLDGRWLVFERYIPGERARWVRESVATENVARLQVKIREQTNGGRGALIGAGAGAVFSVTCLAGEWGSTGPCLGPIGLGAAVGWGFGMLQHSDVWAPAPLPGGPLARFYARASPDDAFGVGLRLPVRLPAP